MKKCSKKIEDRKVDCPVCSGTGTLKVTVVDPEEGKIYNISQNFLRGFGVEGEVNSCHLCHGTGKVFT